MEDHSIYEVVLMTMVTVFVQKKDPVGLDPFQLAGDPNFMAEINGGPDPNYLLHPPKF